jgi:hypothetical protein
MDDGSGPVVGSLIQPASKVNVPVTLSNADNTNVDGWRWEIKDAPAPSPTLNPLPAPVFANTTVITPDVKGHSILVQLITYRDAARTIIDDTDQKVLGVRFDPPFDWLIPAAGETLEVDLIRGWASDVNRTLREVHAVIEGTGIAGFGAFKEVVAGDLVTVPSKIQVNVDGRVKMNGHLVLNGHLRMIGRRRTPRMLPLISGAQEIPNNSRGAIDPSGGPYTLTLKPRGTPGELVELVSISDAGSPPAITVDGQGPLLGGQSSRQITSPREYLRLRRERGNGWSVL